MKEQVGLRTTSGQAASRLWRRRYQQRASLARREFRIPFGSFPRCGDGWLARLTRLAHDRRMASRWIAMLVVCGALGLSVAARPGTQNRPTANAPLQLPTRNPSSLGTQIVLLGTGTPSPDPDRSGPATAVVVNGTPYLIDFGPGVVRRIAAASQKGVTGGAQAHDRPHPRGLPGRHRDSAEGQASQNHRVKSIIDGCNGC